MATPKHFSIASSAEAVVTWAAKAVAKAPAMAKVFIWFDMFDPLYGKQLCNVGFDKTKVSLVSPSQANHEDVAHAGVSGSSKNLCCAAAAVQGKSAG